VVPRGWACGHARQPSRPPREGEAGHIEPLSVTQRGSQLSPTAPPPHHPVHAPPPVRRASSRRRARRSRTWQWGFPNRDFKSSHWQNSCTNYIDKGTHTCSPSERSCSAAVSSRCCDGISLGASRCSSTTTPAPLASPAPSLALPPQRACLRRKNSRTTPYRRALGMEASARPGCDERRHRGAKRTPALLGAIRLLRTCIE
jgi:hypothetical protein